VTVIEHGEVVELYRDGLAAVVGFAGSFDDAAWRRQACGSWSGADTVRHLVAVTGWYHDWLTRSLAGAVDPPFLAAEIDARNQEGVTALGGLDGSQAVARFEADALDYLERAAPMRDRPFGYPYGTITVGVHLGLAATEWHLHAWDLGWCVGRAHQPGDPAALFTAAAWGVTATEPRLRQRLRRGLIPLGTRIAPWQTVLRKSGRSPRARRSLRTG
jgi:hypothetical protein